MANDLANEILKNYKENGYWFSILQQDSQTMQKTIDKALEDSIVLEEFWSWELGSGLSLDEWDGVDRSESIDWHRLEYSWLECR